jgi:hypothetical protein
MVTDCMENAFDLLAKNLAVVSRRQAIGTFLRGTVGALLGSLWFGGRSMRAQSTACTECGTCFIQNATTGGIEAYTTSCVAQTLCNDVQSYGPYTQLTALLEAHYFQPTGYSALFSVSGTSITKVLQTTYVNPAITGNTANLFVIIAPGKQVAAFAVTYQSGDPTSGYTVGTSGIQVIAPPPALPPPFAISASPTSVTVSPGSEGTSTISTSISLGVSVAIEFGVSGLPLGVTASFNPTYIAAPGSGSSTMRITASASTPIGTYAFTVGGKGGGVTETTSVSLTVTPSGALQSSRREPSGISSHKGQLPGPVADSESAELPISNLQNQYCPITCDVIAAAAAVGATIGPTGCANIIATFGAAACVALPPPLSGYCLVAGYLLFYPTVATCVAGRTLSAYTKCTQFCVCPSCSVSNGLICVPSCGSCLYGTCTSDGCSCVAPSCGTANMPCGSGIAVDGIPTCTCCPDTGPSNPYCGYWGPGAAGGGNMCCGNASCCAPTDQCCPPDAGSVIPYCCTSTSNEQ